MDLHEAIRKRRSIRAYRRTGVSDELLRQVITAGIHAPSAGNLQSRRFVAVRDGRLRRRLAMAACDQTFLAEAPVVIVVCADQRIRREYDDRGVALYCLLDCGAATQNMMLAAHAAGLATCWVGAFDEARVARLLKLPPYLRPVTMFPLGLPAETRRATARISYRTACRVI